jgi:molybdopterin-binding protein
MKLSARNRLTGTVVSIRRGEAIANVVVDELVLSEGTAVTAVVKASDVMLAVD